MSESLDAESTVRAGIDEIRPQPRPSQPQKRDPEEFKYSADGRALVSTDDYALVLAEKAADIVEERRKSTTRVIMAGLATTIGIVSYLGVSNLRGLIIEEVRAQVKPIQEGLSASNESSRAALMEGLDSFSQRLELASRSTSLESRDALDRFEDRIKSDIAKIDEGLESTRANARLFDQKLDELSHGLEARFISVSTSSEGLLSEMRESLEAQGRTVTFLALDDLVRELKNQDHMTATQRDSMVSSVLALARTTAALEANEYPEAVGAVVKYLSGASQNTQVDDIDRALWPYLEPSLTSSPGSPQSPRIQDWADYVTEASRHYGRLLIGGDDSQRAVGGETDLSFARYVAACSAARYPESPLALEISLAVTRHGGASEQALLAWDKIRDLTDSEKRFVVLDLIEKTEELAWRTTTTALGKRIERATRQTWLAFERDLAEVLAMPEVVASIKETMLGVPANGLIRRLVDRALAGERPWEG